MTAVAHRLDDEPIDPAAAADFRIIERAHELCNHAPAVDLAAELEQHATRILRAQIRALALLAEMKERGDSDLNVSETCLVETVDDETDEPSVDWAQIAADAWAGASWKEAAAEYQFKRGVRQ
jgi:hypothetical protein